MIRFFCSTGDRLRHVPNAAGGLQRRRRRLLPLAHGDQPERLRQGSQQGVESRVNFYSVLSVPGIVIVEI